MKKFLIGCGAALAVILAISIGVGIFAMRWVQNVMPDTDPLERYQRELRAEYGDPSDWSPPLDGAYDPARIAVYVDIRDELLRVGGPLADRFDEVVAEQGREGGGIGRWISGTRRVVNLLADSLEYVAHGDSLLLARGMGPGEYAHYNFLVLHGLLGVETQSFVDALGAESEVEGAREFLHDMLLEYGKQADAIMRAQVSNALDRAPAFGADAAPSNWRETLGRALAAGRTFPLTDPLPDGFTRAIAPYRTELEVTTPRTPGRLLVESALVLPLEADEDGFRFEYEF